MSKSTSKRGVRLTTDALSNSTTVRQQSDAAARALQEPVGAVKQPFFSIITRTFRRPTLLAVCRQSVLSQNFTAGVEHIIIEDKVGVGIAQSYRALRTQEVEGKYVIILDDDNALNDVDVLTSLAAYIDSVDTGMGAASISAFFVKARVGERQLPEADDIREGNVDAMNIVTSKQVFDEFKQYFGERYSGDWDFIAAVDKAHELVIADIKLGYTQRVSHGAPESEVLVGRTVRCLVSCAGDGFAYDEGFNILVSELNEARIMSLMRAKFVQLIEA